MIQLLYVDDEPDLLEIGRLFLERTREITVGTALSAQEALAMLETRKYDAILSDYLMPGMNGIEFLQVLRSRGDTTPFIIFTGRSREEIVIQALNHGADFYLQKGGDPVSQFAELANIIRKAVAQKQAAAALVTSEAQYRSILENIQDGYYRTDSKGRLILASPSLLRLLGYNTLSEVYGKKISDTFHFDPDEPGQLISAIMESGSVTDYELSFKRRDGTRAYVATSSHTYFDTLGACQGIEGIVRDITAKKQSEDQLKLAYDHISAAEEELRAQLDELKSGHDALVRSEEKLQGIVNGSPIPQFVIDQNHRIISWNVALETYSGIKATDVMGTNQQWKAFYPRERPCMADLVVEGKTESVAEWYAGKYSPSSLVEGAYKATDFFPDMGPSGTWLYFTAAPIRDASGTIIGAVETLEDISDTKRAQQALELINRKLNLMSSVTRHDILNQITALSGYTELLKMSITDPPNVIYLEQIDKAIRNIERQITFTKNYQDLGVKSPSWQNAGHLIRDAQAQLPGIPVTVDAALDSLELFADPLLGKVFYNLIDNAQKHAGTVRKIVFSFRQDESGIILSCEDDGEGIPVDLKEKIFGRGFGKHTGLGLFLAREILAITGLSIRETGIPGSGARFEIRIPKGAYRIVS